MVRKRGGWNLAVICGRTAAPQECNATGYSVVPQLAAIDYIDWNHNNIPTFI